MTEEPMTDELAGDGEALMNAFVDYFNAGDLEGMLDIVDPDISSEFFGVASAKGLLEQLGDFVLSYPGIMMTRGELGEEPIAMAWVPGESHAYRQMGFFQVATDDDESTIVSIGYSDNIDDPDLLVEQPEASEIAEWEDWERWETGEADDGED